MEGESMNWKGLAWGIMLSAPLWALIYYFI